MTRTRGLAEHLAVFGIVLRYGGFLFGCWVSDFPTRL
jgi:hypothetical protein